MHTDSEAPAGAGIAGSSALMIAVRQRAQPPHGRRPWSRKKSAKSHRTWKRKSSAFRRACRITTRRCTAASAPWSSDPQGVRRVAIPVDLDDFNQRIVLCYTGAPRNSGINNWEVTKAYINGDRKVQRNFGHIAAIASAMRAAVEKADWTRSRPPAARRMAAPARQRARHFHADDRPFDRGGQARRDRSAPKSAARAAVAVCSFLWSAARKQRVASAIEKAGGEILRVQVAARGVTIRKGTGKDERIDGSAAGRIVRGAGSEAGRGGARNRVHRDARPRRGAVSRDSRSHGLRDRVALVFGQCRPGREFVAAANRYLFDELGFHGNEMDYNDPRNSCLNYVLDRRTGIPIALSVVYIEVARRLGQPVSGIGLPGHFIVEYNDGEFATYIDPFHSGKLLSVDDCRQLARARTGSDADATALAPVGTRYILVRMLNNLRSAYFRGKRFEKMIAVTDLLLEGFPENAEYYKARGFARLRMRQFRGAQSDLQMYLKYAPEAADRAQVTEQLGAIHRWLGRLN